MDGVILRNSYHSGIASHRGEMDLVGGWVAKLVARIQTSLKNHNWAILAKEWPTHSYPPNKIYKKILVSLALQWEAVSRVSVPQSCPPCSTLLWGGGGVVVGGGGAGGGRWAETGPSLLSLLFLPSFPHTDTHMLYVLYRHIAAYMFSHPL